MHATTAIASTAFDFGPVISAYTRADAIADGTFTDVSTIPGCDGCSRLPAYPGGVAFSPGVAELVRKAVEHPRWMNDYAGIAHDLLWMSGLTRRRLVDGDSRQFVVIITGTGRKRKHVLCVAAEQGGLTFFLPEER